jgi:hypothetical protein
MSRALTQARRLKPGIRLAQSVSEFGALLDGTHAITFKTLQTRSPPTTDDVIRFTEEINRDGSRLHRAWKPYGTRLLRILEQLAVLTKAGDLLVGGSQNMVASGVWAVVRISLQVSTKRSEESCLIFTNPQVLGCDWIPLVLQRDFGPFDENRYLGQD